MPVYSTRCPGCAAAGTVFRRVAERDSNLPLCGCGQQVVRTLDLPFGKSDEVSPFESPATGKMITTRSQLQEDLRTSGCFIYESGVKQDIARNRARNIEKADAALAEKVDRVAAELSLSGRL